MGFSAWIQEQMEQRKWEQSDLARESGITSAQISRILSGARNAGPDACTAIARAFRLPPEEVFRAAGILPPVSPMTTTRREADYLFARLTEEEQRFLLTQMRALVERGDDIAGDEYIAKTPEPA